MSFRAFVVICILLLIALAVLVWFGLRDLAQPGIVAAEAPISLALIPGQGGQWLYVEAPGDAVVSCAGCALGPAQVNGTVRTYTLRALEPGWQVTTTTTVGGSVTLTHGAVVRFPWVGR